MLETFILIISMFIYNPMKYNILVDITSDIKNMRWRMICLDLLEYQNDTKKLAILIKAHKMTFFSSKIIFYIYINMFAFWAFSGAFAAHIILIDEIKLKTQKNLSSRNMQYLKAFFFMECSLVEKFHFGFVFRNHRNIQHKNDIHLKISLLTPFG